ncbi:hypothetical protein F0562_028272 [Nyssa sinensis]|uniref:B30.2/SPRY domain-containing protein n=1 Tax=Nyssa sinensis TaxID=561372 RepID=A0A5J5B7V2_9ASTE|nr:hypothetical protein F0562_028272 [Nyssa sinensis]
MLNCNPELKIRFYVFLSRLKKAFLQTCCFRLKMVNNHKDSMGSYFLELWKLNSKACTDAEMEEEEEAPTELDTLNSSGGFSLVLPDKLSVQYPGVNLHGHDVGVVQANRPAPTKRLVYYFEIFVKNAGAKGYIAIGFTCEGFKMCRQPGWEANSYGYHGDDGLLYRGQGKGEAFGPTFTVGDTVGGGINYASQEFFFTKNGTVVGTVYKEVKGPLFPTIAVHSQNEEVSVNFGKEPFVFDLKAFEAQERAKQQMMIEKISLPQNVSYGLVRSYLLHYGYEDTLKLFDMASRSTLPSISLAQENGFNEQDNTYALNQRKTLRQLIRSGRIDEAFGKLHDWYPQIIQDGTSTTCFLLHCQKFIELIWNGKLEEAVAYGRIEFEKFRKLAGFDDLVKKSSVGYLLEESHRELVADTVNAMILSTNPNIKDSQGCLHSYLERLLRQLTACYLERRSLNGNQGASLLLFLIPSVQVIVVKIQGQCGLTGHEPWDPPFPVLSLPVTEGGEFRVQKVQIGSLLSKRDGSPQKMGSSCYLLESDGMLSTATEKCDQEESASQKQEGSTERSECSQPKPSLSKTDAKRAKQQSAHRSRKDLKFQPELEFLDQQNLILGMENRALRHRLDSITQEQLIKMLEQDMLEREIGRLQTYVPVSVASAAFPNIVESKVETTIHNSLTSHRNTRKLVPPVVQGNSLSPHLNLVFTLQVHQ